ncbi:MAG: hypothetical protein ACRC5C_04135 [Bacilli bacterium]
MGEIILGNLLLLGLAISFFVLGIRYNKTSHEKNISKGSSPNTGSIIGDVIAFLLGGLIQILPWYVTKALVISVGICFLIIMIVNSVY